MCAEGEGQLISDKVQFGQALEAAVGNCPDAFALTCSPGVASSVLQDTPALHALLGYCGISSYKYRIFPSGTISFEDVEYYESKRIFQAFRSGQLNMLTQNEMLALRSALIVCQNAQGDILAREKYLHDELCRMTAYADDGMDGNEDDCCLGPFTLGLANCDGYADAFCLLCSLADIDCHRVSGWSHADGMVEPRFRTQDGHAWNLVCIGGDWLCVDCTWDDTDAGDATYLYYNIGYERLSWTHVLDTSLLPVSLARETAQTYRQGIEEYALPSLPADPWTVLLSAPSQVAFVSDHIQDLIEPLILQLYSYGASHFRYVSNPGAVCFYHISYVSPLTVCFSGTDILGAIESYKNAGTKDFWLTVPGEDGDTLLTSGASGLSELLTQAPVCFPVSFEYARQGNQIHFMHVSYLEHLLRAAGDEELMQGLLSVCGDRPESFAVWLDHVPEEILFRSLARAGVNTYRYTVSGSRYTFSDITYLSHFRSVSTLHEVREYFTSCRELGRTQFALVCSEALYPALSEDGFSSCWELLSGAGGTAKSLQYATETKIIFFEDVTW